MWYEYNHEMLEHFSRNVFFSGQKQWSSKIIIRSKSKTKKMFKSNMTIAYTQLRFVFIKIELDTVQSYHIGWCICCFLNMISVHCCRR